MDYVACKIALGGNSNNVIYRGPDTPVSWPEIRVLQHLHGEDNVFDCNMSARSPPPPKPRRCGSWASTDPKRPTFAFPARGP